MSNEPKTQDATLDDLARENQEISDRLKALPHFWFSEESAMGAYLNSGPLTFAPTFATSYVITARGENLLAIDLQTGEVEAPSIEAASEAGRVFVESVRGYLTKPEGSRYAKLTVAELEAEQAAIECALEAARKAEAA